MGAGRVELRSPDRIADDALATLRAEGRPANVAGMARYGISTGRALGVHRSSHPRAREGASPGPPGSSTPARDRRPPLAERGPRGPDPRHARRRAGARHGRPGGALDPGRRLLGRLRPALQQPAPGQPGRPDARRCLATPARGVHAPCRPGPARGARRPRPRGAGRGARRLPRRVRDGRRRPAKPREEGGLVGAAPGGQAERAASQGRARRGGADPGTGVAAGPVDRGGRAARAHPPGTVERMARRRPPRPVR